MKYAEKLTIIKKVIGLLLLTTLLIFFFISLVSIIFVAYLSYTKPMLDHSARADVIYFLIMAPLVILITSLALSAWLINGDAKITTKLATTSMVFIVYGGIYFLILLKSYPQMQ